MKKLLLSLMLITYCISHAITLHEAREAARDNYPLIKDFNLISLSEQYTLENAGKAWLPQVSAAMQSSWQSAVASYPDALKEMLAQRELEIKGMSKFQYKATVEVKQVIWDGGRVNAHKEAVISETQESVLSNEVELYQLNNRIDEIFFGILLLEEQEKALKSTIELLQGNLNKINSLVKNGAAMQSDADAVEVEMLSTQQQLIAVNSSMISYKSLLSLYTGINDSGPLIMPSNIAMPEGNEMSNRPEIKLMSARQRTLESRINEIKAACMPQIGAFAQGYYGYPGFNFMEAMMNRNPKFNAMIGVSAIWNIGELYTKKNKILSLQASHDRINVAKSTFQFNAELQATQQRCEAEKLRKISESDDEIVTLRERVRKASEAKLREGVVEPTDLLLRITEEKNSKINANIHRIQYLQALYSLQNIFNQ